MSMRAVLDEQGPSGVLQSRIGGELVVPEDLVVANAKELEELLLQHETALRRLRADYEARVQRAAELQRIVEARETELAQQQQELKSELSNAEKALEQKKGGLNNEAMRHEDERARSLALLEERQQKVRQLEQRLRELRRGREQQQQLPEEVDPARAQQELQAKQLRASELRSRVREQQDKIEGLRSDLARILDFIMKVNIEAANTSMRQLTPEDVMPNAAFERMRLSELGQAQVLELLKRHLEQSSLAEDGGGGAVGLAETQARGTPRQVTGFEAVRRTIGGHYRTGMLNPGLDAAAGAAAAPPPGGILQPGLTEEAGGQSAASQFTHRDDVPTASLQDEAALLRRRIVSEMRRVVKVLAEDVQQAGGGRRSEAGHPTSRRNDGLGPREATRELLRAAAWGDQALLRQLVPLTNSTLQGALEDDAALLGWTAWHAAAAHGQFSALEVLREQSMDEQVARQIAVGKLTASGFPPLAVACLQGHVEAARVLLRSRAAVDSRDDRGNTPLFWAAAADGPGQGKLMRLLLEAQADPSARNNSGHRVDLSFAMRNEGPFVNPQGNEASLLARNEVPVAPPRSGGPLPATPVTSPLQGALPMPPMDSAAAASWTSKGASSKEAFLASQGRSGGGGACHCIQSVGKHSSGAEHTGLFSVLKYVTGPELDALDIMSNKEALAQARLNHRELASSSSIWSDWVRNYTHKGLLHALEVSQLSLSGQRYERIAEKYRQGLVLTCERVLFFTEGREGRAWSLVQEMWISDITQALTPAHSDAVLLLRGPHRADVLLDVAMRDRLIDELLTRSGNGVAVSSMSSPVSALLDDRGLRIGTLAFVETHVLTMLPYKPTSLLLSGGQPMFFGFMEVWQGPWPGAWGGVGNGPGWRWQTYFFILKGGHRATRQQLCWCLHPNDDESAANLGFDRIWRFRSEETQEGDHCVLVEFEKYQGLSSPLLLRARDPQSCREWMMNLQALQASAASR